MQNKIKKYNSSKDFRIKELWDGNVKWHASQWYIASDDDEDVFLPKNDNLEK